MFGTYERRLDAKNRMPVPPKLKSDLGNVVFVTTGNDSNLIIRSKTSYDTYCGKLDNLSELNANSRLFKRIIFGNTEEVKVDKLGRILIPSRLLEQAAIKTDVVVIGIEDKVEIWSQTQYNKIKNQMEKQDSLEKLSEKLSKSGILF